MTSLEAARGAVSAGLFSMMVVMALVTTIATSPILRLLKPPTDAAVSASDVR